MTRWSAALGTALGLLAAGAAGATAQAPERIPGSGGVRIAVYEAGNPAGRPIVLIHGFLGTHLTWSSQLSGPLADEFRLVAYDLRGHGASDKPLDPESYTSSAAWADDLAAVIRAKALDRPVLVGWSYGGYVIADYLRAHGSAGLGGVVFVAAVTQAGTAEAQAVIDGDALALFGGMFSEDVMTAVSATRAFLLLLSARPFVADARETLLAGAMMVPPQVRLAMFSRQLDNDDVLAQLDRPALVVHGRLDGVVLQAAAEHLVATVPGAKLLLYDGVGHAVAFEDPARFNHDLAEFVRAVRRP
jgi:pimeloyl-ACP methyl ester carboxylesterase